MRIFTDKEFTFDAPTFLKTGCRQSGKTSFDRFFTTEEVNSKIIDIFTNPDMKGAERCTRIYSSGLVDSVAFTFKVKSNIFPSNLFLDAIAQVYCIMAHDQYTDFLTRPDISGDIFKKHLLTVLYSDRKFNKMCTVLECKGCIDMQILEGLFNLDILVQAKNLLNNERKKLSNLFIFENAANIDNLVYDLVKLSIARDTVYRELLLTIYNQIDIELQNKAVDMLKNIGFDSSIVLYDIDQASDLCVKLFSSAMELSSFLDRITMVLPMSLFVKQIITSDKKLIDYYSDIYGNLCVGFKDSLGDKDYYRFIGRICFVNCVSPGSIEPEDLCQKDFLAVTHLDLLNFDRVKNYSYFKECQDNDRVIFVSKDYVLGITTLLKSFAAKSCRKVIKWDRSRKICVEPSDFSVEEFNNAPAWRRFCGILAYRMKYSSTARIANEDLVEIESCMRKGLTWFKKYYDVHGNYRITTLSIFNGIPLGDLIKVLSDNVSSSLLDVDVVQELSHSNMNLFLHIFLDNIVSFLFNNNSNLFLDPASRMQSILSDLDTQITGDDIFFINIAISSFCEYIEISANRMYHVI